MHAHAQGVKVIGSIVVVIVAVIVHKNWPDLMSKQLVASPVAVYFSMVMRKL